MCPVGYEEMPEEKHNVYKRDLQEKDVLNWIILADQSKMHPTFTCLKWDDIMQDLTSEHP